MKSSMLAQSSALEPGVRVMHIGTASLLVAARPWALLASLAALLSLMTLAALSLGDTPLAPMRITAALVGAPILPTDALLLEFRLPRVLLALLAGGALGLAGALLQAVTRNALASPELLGLSDGALFAMLITLALAPDAMLGPWWVGPAGALLAATLLFAAAGKLDSRGQRLLLIGVAAASLWRALGELAMSQEMLVHAGALYAWSVGSFSGKSTTELIPMAAGLVMLTPIALLLARPLAILRFTPDHAATLGVRVARIQITAVLVAVALAGLAVGLAGPLAFVSLAAPALARLMADNSRQPFIATGLIGGALILAADTGGRLVLPAAELPAGVLANLFGGPFLLWLLWLSRRSDV